MSLYRFFRRSREHSEERWFSMARQAVLFRHIP